MIVSDLVSISVPVSARFVLTRRRYRISYSGQDLLPPAQLLSAVTLLIRFGQLFTIAYSVLIALGGLIVSLVPAKPLSY